MTVFKNFKHAKEKGTKIFWFDHHIVEEKIQHEIQDFCEIYINDTDKCAAEIVQAYFLPDDVTAKKIASLAHDSDFKEYKFDISNNLQLIIEHNRGDSKIQEKNRIVDLLSKGEFENDWFKSQLRDLNEWYERESKLALGNTIKISLENNQEVAISYAKLGGGKITDLLSEKYPGLFAYFGIDARFNEIIIRSSKINCRDFARSFGGGGHKMRAGFSYQNLFKKETLTQKFVFDMKKKLSYYT